MRRARGATQDGVATPPGASARVPVEKAGSRVDGTLLHRAAAVRSTTRGAAQRLGASLADLGTMTGATGHPPHGVYQLDVDYAEVIRRANERGESLEFDETQAPDAGLEDDAPPAAEDERASGRPRARRTRTARRIQRRLAASPYTRCPGR
jgi:hypothetical protein